MRAFTDILTGFHRNFTFKWRFLFEGAVFLDTQWFRDEFGSAFTRLYRKPDNAYLYLNRRSSHPEHMFAFIRGEGVRICRCCTRKEDFLVELAFFSHKLMLRGYSPSLVENGLNKVAFELRSI